MGLLAGAVSGCGPLQPTGARILDYHAQACLTSIETFTRRLYAKNPKYEPNPAKRREKLEQLLADQGPAGELRHKTSDALLTAAFAKDSAGADRVYLLGLGLVKSIREAYGLGPGKILVTGMQVPLERLQRLHHNISQVNWRLKTYRDDSGDLLFQTNAAGENGYINMGYEVLMTQILTRIQDDIHLRGGLPGKYAFDMSAFFLSILL